MQNRHDHNPSRLRLSAARMIIGVGCLLAVFLLMPAQPSAAQEAGASLPQPLSDFDVGQYQRLFHLQEVGRMKQAVREAGRVENDILMGHLLSKRYLHPTAWRSTYKQLYRWLSVYNDHPDASRIYWLAKRRRPGNAKAPTAPKAGYLNGFGLISQNEYRPRMPLSSVGRASPRTTRRIAREVRRAIRRGWPTGALKVVDDPKNRRYLTKVEEAQLRGEIAHAYFIFGLDQKAIREARHAIGAGRDSAFMGYWAGGLAAWRSGQYDLAGQFFRSLAEQESVFDELRSAAAFWAQRVALRQGRPEEAARFLDLSASVQHGFYGVIARQASGQQIDVSFNLPARDPAFLTWLGEQKGGQRLFALMQIGLINDAEREMRYLWADIPVHMRSSALRFAIDNGMAGLAYRAGALMGKNEGKTWYGALYPVPKFEAEFTVDQALVWAIARQESGFNPRAKSRAKAAGLMQIMPSTASFIMRKRSYRSHDRHLLLNPVINLEIGQRYIRHLLEEPVIDGSLVKLLAAYNGGPGNLSKWLRKVDHQDDPFLLIESIPSRETRSYIKSVITNLAMYRMQFGQSAPALKALAAGRRGTFVSLIDQTAVKTARLEAKQGQ
ncbi:MAG: transglycosylase SLT domain-containing protein [Alphaproteobacteria bacterium]